MVNEDSSDFFELTCGARSTWPMLTSGRSRECHCTVDASATAFYRRSICCVFVSVGVAGHEAFPLLARSVHVHLLRERLGGNFWNPPSAHEDSPAVLR